MFDNTSNLLTGLLGTNFLVKLLSFEGGGRCRKIQLTVSHTALALVYIMDFACIRTYDTDFCLAYVEEL